MRKGREIMKTRELVKAYYEAFNRQDRPAILKLLSDDVIHDINQGGRDVGKAKFNSFLDKMDVAYLEKLTDLVIMVDESGRHAAAEFTVNGTYLKTDPGLPEARGQKYVLPAGAFLEIDTEKNLISRVSTHYNLPLWIQMVSQA